MNALQNGGSTSVGSVVGVIALVLFGLGMWILPIFIAVRRKASHTASIVVIDLLLGWTFFGWVGALAWAIGDSPRSVPK